MGRCHETGEARKRWYQNARKEFYKEVERPLSEKIPLALQFIAEATSRFGDKMALACSFGKDSMTMLHLTRQIAPDINVAFCNTGIEFKETLEHRDLIVKEWSLNYHEVKPETTAFAVWRKYGIPGTTRTKTREPKCCWELKVKPMIKWVRKHNAEAIMVGILGPESEMRQFAAVRDGQLYYAKSLWKCWKVHPLLYWVEEDILEYHEQHEIPLNRAYAKYDIHRTGCAPCTNHPNWERQVREWNPGLYKIIQRMKGQTLLEVE